mmetsp:Transcript_80144/g.224956  ORF Transcript_80144/g.224956 Transcript_80144/m.224956 type:complete len:220 (-) Transcript_80144:576-1235(-)
MMGCSLSAKEMALSMKEVSVTLVPYLFSAEALSDFCTWIMAVTSISSPRAMIGTLSASFMDFTMPLPTLSVISTNLSSPGLMAGLVGAAAAGAPPGAALAGAATTPEAAARTSASSTRPMGPEPATTLRSTPFSLAKCRIFGVARTPGAFKSAFADAFAGAAFAGAALAGAAFGAAAAAGVEGAAAVGAPPPAVSISTRMEPTFTVSPTLNLMLATLPV